MSGSYRHMLLASLLLLASTAVQAAIPPCDPGTYSASGYKPCQVCPSGQFTTAFGAKACTTCLAGFSCIDATLPAPCPPGTYSGPGAVQCLSCPSGTSSGGASTSCTTVSCEAGTYFNTATQSCTSCSAGSRCTGGGAAPEPCTPGTFSPAGQSVCTPCSQGAVSGAGSEACTVCSTATVPNGDSSACIPAQLCGPGSFPDAGDCTLCTPGWYCTGSNSAPIQCPANTWSQGGDSYCMECPTGQWSEAGSTECNDLQCPSGYYTNGHQCSLCPAGSYCPDPMGGPESCPANTYAPIASTECLPCPSGWTSDAGASVCTQQTQCDAGFYLKDGACTSCPAGFRCTNNQASQCPANTFSTGGKFSCTSCPAGLTSSPGSSSCHPPVYCSNGAYHDGNGCSICPAGSFCQNDAAAPTPCPTGMYSATGQAACQFVCPAGYVAVPPNQCVPGCPAGFYKSNGLCVICPAGSFCSDPNGAPTLCPANTSSSSGATTCMDCGPGYTSAVGSSRCTQTAPSCTPGQYLDGSNCVSCPAGSFCSDPSQAPALCPADTFSADGATACTDCEDGYTSDAGSSQCSRGTPNCTPGQYLDGDDCVACPAGSSCSNPSQTPTLCPANTFSAGGATVCTNCEDGYTSGVGSSQCSREAITCQPGQYLDDNTCVTCPAGFACPDPSTALKNACPRNTFAIAGQTSCTLCPAGTTSPPASSSCGGALPEPSGTFNRRNEPIGMHSRCAFGQKRCPVPGVSMGGGYLAVYECVDVRNDLESCGGCVYDDSPNGEINANGGRDCTAIPGVESVMCVRGLCLIDACKPGFVVGGRGSSCEAL